MKYSGISLLTVAALSLGNITPAMAAQQCFAQAGTYGNLVVTTSGAGCGSPIIGVPPSYLQIGSTNADQTCQFTLSPAAPGSSVTTEFLFVNAFSIGTAEEMVVAMNGSQVNFQAGDLVSGNLVPGTGTPTAPTVGGVTDGSGVNTIFGASGTIAFAAAPAAVSTVELRYNWIAGTPIGIPSQICADDAGVPPPPSATPVPTMSVYGLALTVLGLLLVTTRRLRAPAKGR
jgi:hypothetical protein